MILLLRLYLAKRLFTLLYRLDSELMDVWAWERHKTLEREA